MAIITYRNGNFIQINVYRIVHGHIHIQKGKNGHSVRISFWRIVHIAVGLDCTQIFFQIRLFTGFDASHSWEVKSDNDAQNDKND